MRSIITLTSDFGQRDAYVAAMKGVILGIAPEVQLVDICHTIEPQNVPQAAFVIWQGSRWFPPVSIHLVVVDPDVGGERRALALKIGGRIYVAPDNGVLTLLLRDGQLGQAVALENPAYWLSARTSSTFHGRDIFAPVAAHLAAGIPLAALGSLVKDPVMLDLPRPIKTSDGEILGHVLHVDHFGNVISDIPGNWLESRSTWMVHVGETQIEGIARTYAAVARGELLALVASHGLLEIAQRDGNAAERLAVSSGAAVRATPGH